MRLGDVLDRRRFLKGAMAISAAGAVGAFPRAARAQHAPPIAEYVTFEVPGLDPAHDGLRVAQLSDLHVGGQTSSEVIRLAIEEANRFEPDLVALTGDFLSRSPDELEILRVLVGGLAAPTVAVLGNHDVWIDPEGTASVLRLHGYEVLENSWTSIRLRGVRLPVVGIGDHLTHRDDVPLAVRGLPASAPTPLVLAHGPRTAEGLRSLERPAVCLSGHTHGGQINVPIVTRLLLASLREPYVRGHYEVGEVQLYVNRGIGTSALRVRVNSPPEVTLATLRRIEPGTASLRRPVPRRFAASVSREGA